MLSWSIFRFIPRPTNNGVGVANLALVQPYGPPAGGSYPASRMVRGSLSVTRKGTMVLNAKKVVPVALGNGGDLTGQLALTALVKMQGSAGQ